VVCGELRRHVGLGMCGRCWQRYPDRPFVRGQTLAARLAEPPSWLDDFVAYLAAHYCPAQACKLITTLARLLEGEHPNHPQSVLEQARRPGRSMGSLARSLEAFFTERALAMATDQVERLAAGRRKNTPAGMRAAVAAFAESMLRARERARRAGTRPCADRTIDSALATVRDLARFLDTQRHKQDWALVDVADIEAFLAEWPNNRGRRLTVLGQFFRFARNHHVVLVDPTRGGQRQLLGGGLVDHGGHVELGNVVINMAEVVLEGQLADKGVEACMAASNRGFCRSSVEPERDRSATKWMDATGGSPDYVRTAGCRRRRSSPVMSGISTDRRGNAVELPWVRARDLGAAVAEVIEMPTPADASSTTSSVRVLTPSAITVGFSDMTEPSGNLEARLDALEARVDELAEQLQQARQDAVAARVLAGGADRDVEQARGEIRDFRQATVASFNAMRDDLIDLGTRMDSGFSDMRGRLDTTAAGLTHITTLLNGLIAGRGDDTAEPE
jgi:hypothetical protein